jgi:hypothetical protein
VGLRTVLSREALPLLMGAGTRADSLASTGRGKADSALRISKRRPLGAPAWVRRGSCA